MSVQALRDEFRRTWKVYVPGMVAIYPVAEVVDGVLRKREVFKSVDIVRSRADDQVWLLAQNEHGVSFPVDNVLDVRKLRVVTEASVKTLISADRRAGVLIKDHVQTRPTWQYPKLVTSAVSLDEFVTARLAKVVEDVEQFHKPYRRYSYRSLAEQVADAPVLIEALYARAAELWGSED